MNRLSDVSFVIPLRIDSSERSRNLDLVLNFISQHFDSKVIILEADQQRRYFPGKPSEQITYMFVEDRQQRFHRTKYLNRLYRMVNSPLIAVWDTDAIISPVQIVKTANRIRRGEAVMGLPYDGYAYETTTSLVDKYQRFPDLNLLERAIPLLHPMYGKLSVGGAFLVDSKKYKQAGGENEYFTGWGPEDIERVKRMDILHGIPIYRSEGCLYHLWHPRNSNSWYTGRQNEILEKQELLKICGMNRKDLRNYIRNCPWMRDLCGL